MELLDRIKTAFARKKQERAMTLREAKLAAAKGQAIDLDDLAALAEAAGETEAATVKDVQRLAVYFANVQTLAGEVDALARMEQTTAAQQAEIDAFGRLQKEHFARLGVLSASRAAAVAAVSRCSNARADIVADTPEWLRESIIQAQGERAELLRQREYWQGEAERMRETAADCRAPSRSGLSAHPADLERANRADSLTAAYGADIADLDRRVQAIDERIAAETADLLAGRV